MDRASGFEAGALSFETEHGSPQVSQPDLFAGKVCTRCGRWFNRNEYARDRANRDGRTGICRACHRGLSRAHYRANRDEYLARIYLYDCDNPRKHAARNAVANALASGSLTRQPCEECGAGPADAHHDDYAEPLAVRWLCRRHHLIWHARNGEGANAEGEVARA